MARGQKCKRKSRREEVGICEAEKVIASRHVGGKVEFRLDGRGMGQMIIHGSRSLALMASGG